MLIRICAAGVGQLLDRIALIEAALPELLVVPGVLADGERDVRGRRCSAELRRIAGHEIARFVEDVVGGQQHLCLPEQDLAALQIAALLVARLPAPFGDVPT